MKLLEALTVIQKPEPKAAPMCRIGLVCGFTPLHLQTFLAAHLRLLCPERRFQIVPGLYGDIWGNLERLVGADCIAVIVQLEWDDLDPRLGLRRLGSWSPASFADIVASVRAAALRLQQAIERLSRTAPVVLSLPSLPFPPVSHAPGWEASPLELEINAILQLTALAAARVPDVRVASSTRLDRISPPAERFDPKSEIASGFPYTLLHSSALAELLARLIQRPVPMKGLITDLDDTLWKGIVGEDGVSALSWDLEHSSHVHGSYQRFLHALSGAGVLIGAASRNEAANVEEAFAREDMILPRQALFPIVANWDSKSDSVRSILRTWNVAADSVVFIDDSPIELAEVKAAFPEIECILFPKDNPKAHDHLLHRLRDLFGKTVLSSEDAIRLESIRQTQLLREERGDHTDQWLEFLKQAEAQITFHFPGDHPDPRALELVNKTNQFNLNGTRYSEAEWNHLLRRPGAFLILAEYCDKYGPLGKIAVLAGVREKHKIIVDSWVMSCRAFGRRIEHRCLEEIFRRWDAAEVIFHYQPTHKNNPMTMFLAKVLGENPAPACRLKRELFFSENEEVHRVVEVSNG